MNSFNNALSDHEDLRRTQNKKAIIFNKTIKLLCITILMIILLQLIITSLSNNTNDNKCQISGIDKNISNNSQNIGLGESSIFEKGMGFRGNNNTSISIAFFFDPECDCTEDAMVELEKINSSFKNIHQFWYDISEFSNRTKWIRYMDAYNVPSTLRPDTPFLFVGDYYFHHYGVSFENLSVVFEKYADEHVPLYPEWTPVLTIHIAFFYDNNNVATPGIFTAVDLLNDTWNEEDRILIIHEFSLGNPTNGLLLAAFFEEYNLSLHTSFTDPSDIYCGVFVGDYFFLNSNVTLESLNQTVLEYLGQNVPLKDISIDIAGGKICLIFFYSPTCGDCHKARKILENMKGKYPELDVKEYNIADPKNDYYNRVLQESYFDVYGVDDDLQGTLGVFIGDDYFIDPDDLEDDIEKVIRGKLDGCPCPEVEADKDVVVKKFTSFTIAAVLFAGLVDSINPCAIATLIFFIGYLSRTGRTKKQVLIIGIAYTLGIFITYMALGLGLYSLIATSSNELEMFSRALYPTMAIITILFGFYSVYDFVKARKGKKEDMKLQLPKSVKSLIGRVIKHQVQLKYFALIAIITGVLISLLEFLCTGQVYLPTIMVVVATVPEYQFQAGAMLLLYNLMFIMPLIIIFLGVYNGMSSEQLQGTLDRNRALFKLLTAIVFFVLAGFLIWYSWAFLF
jgi:cytochrome c biogenesis protein CcdA